MPTSDLREILLKHDEWATRQMLDACASLLEEQFHRRFDMGPGSLHDTLVHMLGAMRAWTDVLGKREMRPRPEGQRFNARELIPMFEAAAKDLAASVGLGPQDELLTRERGGKTWRFTRGAVVVHVITHSMHHRAQCLNMLRQVGVKDLPPSSVMEWVIKVDLPQ